MLQETGKAAARSLGINSPLSVSAKRLLLGWRTTRSRDRKAEHEDSSAFRPIVTGDLAAMVLHHAVRGAQAKPSALADRLGGIERIKDALGFQNARSRIGELQQQF